jgi:hypothetical protein
MPFQIGQTYTQERIKEVLPSLRKIGEKASSPAGAIALYQQGSEALFWAAGPFDGSGRTLYLFLGSKPDLVSQRKVREQKDSAFAARSSRPTNQTDIGYDGSEGLWDLISDFLSDLDFFDGFDSD